ncbi:hypothetical protein [Streptomyces sp. NBC_00009]
MIMVPAGAGHRHLSSESLGGIRTFRRGRRRTVVPTSVVRYGA